MGDTSAKSRVGSRVGPYQLRRLLGRGGMGEVYEAYDTRKDRVVALKLMSEEVSQNPLFRERMQREAHTAGRLQEPHIVPIHDYGQIDGQMFIDMRFIEGSDIGSLLNRCGSLAPPRAVAIVRQVAAALDSAHRAGVIHRDIKPENILITDDDFAYLVDFGIAAAVTDEHLTQTGAAVGTWQYMAPERFGTAEVTYRVDIYALACVLFECLVGAPPYRADSLSALVGAHLHQAIPRPSQLHQGIPPAFDEVIARGMAKQPADRFARAGDLAQAAQNALSSSGQDQALSLLRRSQEATRTGAHPATLAATLPPVRPPWVPPAGAAPRSRKPWLILGTAVLLIVATLAGLAIWHGTRRHDAGPRPNEPTATDHAAAPTVPVARLDALLLTSSEIHDILNTSDTQIGGTTKRLDNTPYTLSNPNCLGALYSLMQPAYAGSGYTAVAAETSQGQGNSADQLVNQGVVAFPSVVQASAFVEASAANWKACAGQTLTQTQNGSPAITWALKDLVGNAPKITQLATMKNDNGLVIPCQHALSAVSNVVLDVGVCGAKVSDQAGRIADAMAAKVAN